MMARAKVLHAASLVAVGFAVGCTCGLEPPNALQEQPTTKRALDVSLPAPPRLGVV